MDMNHTVYINSDEILVEHNDWMNNIHQVLVIDENGAGGWVEGTVSREPWLRAPEVSYAQRQDMKPANNDEIIRGLTQAIISINQRLKEHSF